MKEGHMRQHLLAGAAMIGSIGVASAQTPTTTTTLPPAPLSPGIPTQPSVYLGGNNILNEDGTGFGGSSSAPTPGSFVVHLNFRVWGYVGFGGGSGYVNGLANSASSLGAANAGIFKLAPAQFIGYFRMYPGVDAMATNGLRYGAIVEIRQNFIGQTYGSTSAGLNGPGGNYSTSPSSDSSASTLYVRREGVYIGSNQVGIVRLGQLDGPFSVFDNGVTTFQFGTGAWNGDAPDNLPDSGVVTFPFWSQTGAEYGVSKLAYFSPEFYGFDVGASFAPNNGANNAAACTIASPGCLALTSTTSSSFGGGNRPINWYQVMGRYEGEFAGLGVYGIFGYSGSGAVNQNGAASLTRYNGFGVGDGGLVLSYGGFSVGGNVQWGSYNNAAQLKPQGAPNAIAWLVGAQYVYGPFTIAGSYYNYQYQGSAAAVNISQRYDDAGAAGVTWAIAPGLNAYAEYLYGQSHQGDVNLFTGSLSHFYNNTHVQSFIIGTRVQW
jgi:outer membrane protein OmpU